MTQIESTRVRGRRTLVDQIRLCVEEDGAFHVVVALIAGALEHRVHCLQILEIGGVGRCV